MSGYPCCCAELLLCNSCENGSVPSEYLVEIAGITEDGCGGCVSTFNDIFTLALVNPENFPGICLWGFAFDERICFVDELYLVMSVAPPNVILQVYFDGITDILRFQEDLGAAPVDCGFVNQAVARFAETGFLWGCDGATATCKVTAVP